MTQNNSKIILAILWPFGALVSALRNWRQPWAMNVFWMVCIYMGAIQIYHPAGTILGEGADGGRYALQLIEMHSRNTNFQDLFTRMVDMDLYQFVLTWVVSLFTNNGHVLFVSFAAVFGFFYSRNMWFVLKRITSTCNASVLIFIAVLFLICPIWQINGVRMWTAAHVFTYALLPYIFEGNRKRLFWLIAVPFIHFSFLYFVVLSSVFVLLPNRFTSNFIIKWGLVSFFIASMVLTTVNVPAITHALEQFSPESYQDRIDLYTRDVAFDNMYSGRMTVNWYVTLASDIRLWVSNIFLLIIAVVGIKDKHERKLLYYTLLISSIANIASQLPSGGRFLTIANIFSYSLIIWQISKQNNGSNIINVFARIAAISLIITIIFGIRQGFDYYGISLFFGNFLTSFFWDNNVPFINLIK